MSLVRRFVESSSTNETVAFPEDILLDKNGGVNVAKDVMQWGV